MLSKTAQREITFSRSGVLHISVSNKHPFKDRDVYSPCLVSVSDSIGILSSLGLGRRGRLLSHWQKSAQSYITNTGIPKLLPLPLPSPAFLGGWEM